MKDYSLPPYDLATIGIKVAELCKEFGVSRVLGMPDGYYGLPFLSEAIVEIAAKNGLQLPVVVDLEDTGKQLQQLLLFIKKA